MSDFEKRTGCDCNWDAAEEFTESEWATWERFEAAEPVTEDDE